MTEIGFTSMSFDKREDSSTVGPASDNKDNARNATMEGMVQMSMPFSTTPFSKKMRRTCDTPETFVSHEGEDSPTAEDHNNNNLDGSNRKESEDNEHRSDEVVEDEPDWEKLAENEPAALEQVELFLKTREIRDEADERFSNVMDECNTALENAKKRILQAAADMHNMHREELDYLESEIKQTLVWNHQVRSKMKRELEETRARAQGLFSQLLMTVSQPLSFDGGASVRRDNAGI